MSFGQGGPQQPQWDPWKPQSEQQWNAGGTADTPDWAALAEASEARAKRRRVFFIGGGALATVAIGAAVATAVVSANGSDDDVNALPSATLPSPTPTAPSFEPTTAPPPLDPKDFVSTKQKDTAPLTPDGLFPGTRLTVGSTVYQKGPTDSQKSCATATAGTLPKVLTANGCTLVMRASYTVDGIASTVGIAVFDTEAQAQAAKKQADNKSIVKALTGKGVKNFCNGAVCFSTTNSYGRYAYFTLTGFTSGKDVTKTDTEVMRTGNDLADFAFRQIRRRGEVQASAAANQ
ncbi:hypothetical protein MTQ10_01150 [Streptomyces sp. XM83C]|jgi:hypothetical protein|uniref:Tat pathway signal sequence domain protein n=1 Tax=Streptomyces thermocoprophilus TaxID=78356 RepID=A0ABV5VA59_9ACTN|nr:hypothetical protein [Streptomyces sp. XM83C]MCK1818242.1 hypothetical protein [Streptomyces sp. XM83C]